MNEDSQKERSRSGDLDADVEMAVNASSNKKNRHNVHIQEHDQDRGRRSRSSDAASREMVSHRSDGQDQTRSTLLFAFLRRERGLPSKERLNWMFIALCMIMVLEGCNDGAQGPLIPYLQEHYNIGFLTMSLIWVTSFFGSLIAGISGVYLTDRLGFGLVSPIAALLQAFAFSIASLAPPYPLFAGIFIFNGMGFGLEEALANTMTSRLPSPAIKLCLLHSAYGLGATIAPFISTQFVKYVPQAYKYYLIAMAVAVFTAVLLAVVFEGRTEDQVIAKRVSSTADVEDGEEAIPLRSNGDGEELGGDGPGDTVEMGEKGRVERHEGSGGKLWRVLRLPAVWALVLYSVIYVGIEVSLGGWTTSFLIHERGGDDDAGYATAGYWGGLTLGRIFLIPLTRYLGHRNAVHAYSFATLLAQISIWVIPSLYLNALAFALSGFFLGPIYPSALMIVTEILPDELHLGAISLMGSSGGAGSALMPFITGALSDRFGIWILSPMEVTLVSSAITLWFFVAGAKPRA